MITNCVPFAIWISGLLTIVVFFIAFRKKDELTNFPDILVYFFLSLMISTGLSVILLTLPVVERESKEEVIMKHTRVESLAFTNGVIAKVFPLQKGATNGPHTIIKKEGLNFLESPVTSDYVYIP